MRRPNHSDSFSPVARLGEDRMASLLRPFDDGLRPEAHSIDAAQGDNPSASEAAEFIGTTYSQVRRIKDSPRGGRRLAHMQTLDWAAERFLQVLRVCQRRTNSRRPIGVAICLRNGGSLWKPGRSTPRLHRHGCLCYGLASAVLD
jgi:hypothetical protein